MKESRSDAVRSQPRHPAGPRLEPLLQELEGAAQKLGIKVSYEALAESVAGGGLCKVKGIYRVIIEKRSTVGEKVSMLGRALAQVGADDVFLSPAARALVDPWTTLGSTPAAGT